MGSDKLTPAQRILASLDEFLDTRADITLYGRAAFALGFNPEIPEIQGEFQLCSKRYV